MWCATSTLYVCLLLGAADAQRFAFGSSGLHEATEDEICRGNPHITCQNGECVPAADAGCDGVIQCQDGSDESNCIDFNGCILPQQPIGGSYQLNWCTGNLCNVVPGMIVPRGSFLTYTCNEGYTLIGNMVSHCHINAWYLLPSCVETCPALRSDSVDFDCRYHGTQVSCETGIIPGTKAIMTCKYLYKIPLGNEPGYLELNCLRGGVWDRASFNCIPECGIAVPRGSTKIVNGYTVEMPGAFPWHVAVYRKSDTGGFEQICAGTLVSPDLVISAAHCFYDDTVNRPQDASQFAVAAGKYHRLYNWPERYDQKSTIERIYLPERYVGAIQNWAHDIALLRLDTRFKMTSFVMPVCMDWHNEYESEHLRNQQRGKVMGWGRTATGESSLKLQAITLPYVDFRRCIAAAPNDFRALITADKFCAGYRNGSSVCDGDSGGGLCFEHQGTWVLRGIVSVGPVTVKDGYGSCDNNFYAALTEVGYHMKLIRDATLGTR